MAKREVSKVQTCHNQNIQVYEHAINRAFSAVKIEKIIENKVFLTFLLKTLILVNRRGGSYVYRQSIFCAKMSQNIYICPIYM